jgi:hypothetical protein
MAKIVYVLTNAVMPGVVKIGKTDKEDVAMRVKELFTTGVPVPYDCVYACTVDDNTIAERSMHDRFSEHRINPKREFFWLNPKTAVKALKRYEIEDVTPGIRARADSAIPDEEKNARWEARQLIEKQYPGYADGKYLHSAISKSVSDK